MPKAPRKPIKPLPSDCCGTGCDRCVYAIYHDQLKDYQAWLEEHPETACTPLDEGIDEELAEAKHRSHKKLKIRDDQTSKPYSPFD
ncbi:MAG: oxidoreductase-like domain-containing protein [Bacteroidota bacterium]